MTVDAPPSIHPGVSVVIATRGRPEMLRRALRSILGQEYAAPVEVVVVFDRCEIDPLSDLSDLISELPVRRLRTLANSRTAGLAGGRNTGIIASAYPMVALCDDDDEWQPGKLAAQADLLALHPEAIMVASSISIESTGGTHDRLAPAVSTHSDLIADRITALHPSGFMFRRSDLLGRVGLVDEELPASYGEDYDLLLRATEHGVVVAVTEPQVIVHWNRQSFFTGRWQGIADGLSYLLAKHGDFANHALGAARVEAQVAFAHGALGDRRQARTWALQALRHDPRQWRAWSALAISTGLVKADWVVSGLNRLGRGV